ncbi:MAG: PIN domain-containing protein [Gammaproteobacteria bacterium]|nr:PIN domain-containing protein [Gammaproteobacteria bacterium]
MIAVDTNILVYAHRRDSAWNEPAYARMAELSEGRALWAIPWPCIHEFLSIVTHPRIYDPPSTIAEAISQVDAWLESPTLELLGESDDHWSALQNQLTSGKVRGSLVHDARVVALCITNGVSELLTADRDFGRFSGLKIRNPLVETNR